MQEIKTHLAPSLAQVRALIEDALRSDVQLLDTANRTLLERPGKMVRPMVTLLCAGAAGAVNGDSLRFAAATELLHNATLLHDDVVDASPERRGRPTMYRLMGGQASVLLGDYWLVRCMDTILASARYGNQVIRIFARTLEHLVEGELLQMQMAREARTTQQEYLRIIYGKTASLFEAAAESGAVSVNASAEVTTALKDYARQLGLAFQIKDDIFDYEDAAGAIGKPVGIDLLEQKITQPLLCALQDAPEADCRYIRGLVAGMAEAPGKAGEVQAFVQARDGIRKAVAVLDDYVAKAVSCLDVLGNSAEKQYLAQMAQFVGARNQ